MRTYVKDEDLLAELGQLRTDASGIVKALEDLTKATADGMKTLDTDLSGTGFPGTGVIGRLTILDETLGGLDATVIAQTTAMVTAIGSATVAIGTVTAAVATVTAAITAAEVVTGNKLGAIDDTLKLLTAEQHNTAFALAQIAGYLSRMADDADQIADQGLDVKADVSGSIDSTVKNWPETYVTATTITNDHLNVHVTNDVLNVGVSGTVHVDVDHVNTIPTVSVQELTPNYPTHDEALVAVSVPDGRRVLNVIAMGVDVDAAQGTPFRHITITPSNHNEGHVQLDVNPN